MLSQDFPHQLLLACAPGKQEALQVLLAQASVDVNGPLPINVDTQQHLTPLSVAAILNNLPACKLLLKAGADVDQSGGGRSALHWAVLAGHFGVVKELLAGGAKQDMQDAEVSGE